MRKEYFGENKEKGFDRIYVVVFKTSDTTQTYYDFITYMRIKYGYKYSCTVTELFDGDDSVESAIAYPIYGTEDKRDFGEAYKLRYKL